MEFHQSLEMSLSREEFFRLLPAAVSAFDVDGEMVQWFDGDRRWTIRLIPLADQRLGSVVIPRHRIEVVLAACPDEEGEAFMGRFHRAFLRAGG